MPDPFTSRQGGAFLRSVMPAKPAQLLLLVGSTFLFISNRVAWGSHFGSYAAFPSYAAYAWWIRAFLLSLPLFVAGAAGYYIAFLRTKRPARLLWYWVLLPSFVDILTIVFFAFATLSRSIPPTKSILEQNSNSSWNLFWRTTMNLGPGLLFGAVGLILVAVFTLLLMRGHATAPMQVKALTEPAARDVDGTPDSDHRRTMIFVWAMICLTPLTWAAQYVFFRGIWNQTFLRYVEQPVATWVREAVAAGLLLVFVLVAMGTQGRKDVPQTIRFSPIKYILLAFLFPVAVATVWPLLNYAHDRILWASYQWGKFYPPALSVYFGTLSVISVRFFIFALPEEIAWRAYLQPKLVERYGIARGIFFVGIVWSAFHFWGDFSGYQSSRLVIFSFVVRIATMTIISYVLGWLTIKSRSILPAVVAHAVYNITVADGFVSLTNPLWLKLALWAALGYAVFRFDPPKTETVTINAQISPELSDGTESGGVEST